MTTINITKKDFTIKIESDEDFDFISALTARLNAILDDDMVVPDGMYSRDIEIINNGVNYGIVRANDETINKTMEE